MAASIISAIALAASLAEYGYSAANQPTAPNLSQESAKMAEVQAELLPELRQLQAAEQLGGTATIPATAKEQQQATNLSNQIAGLQNRLTQLQSGTGADGRPGAVNQKEITALQNEIAAKQAQLAKVPKTQNYDFAGEGAADIQGKIAQALAQGQLATEQKYDPQFIAAALQQEQQADPERFAARSQLYNDIQSQIANLPDSPVADELNRQVTERVNAGSNLTPEEQSMLDTAVKQGAEARGGADGNIDFSQPLTTGTAGTQRQMANAGAGINWLSSGETPADIKYRAEQQNLSNLSSYISGQTPEAQFGELSGAQRGATPIAQAQPLPGANPNAGQQGAAAAVTNYGLNVEQALNQPNPWLAGVSGVLGGLNVAASAGYKPFATGATA